MTIQELKEAGDMAETYPNSGVINFGEISWLTLEAWVNNRISIGYVSAKYLDVESIKDEFERWWKRENKKEVAG
jgi:hypothetical protein